MNKLLSKLNEQQFAAVTAQNQYIRVVAGAGSGKTRVLTNRIIYLIEAMGIAPNSILAITFTNKAAKEMKKRVVATLGSEKEAMQISTFHSFCNRLLREDIRVLDYPKSFVIVDEEEKEKLIKRIIKEMSVKESITPSSAISFISNCKNAKITYQQALADAGTYALEKIRAEIYQKYEKYLQEKKYLDFDDLIILTVKILKDYPAIQHKWHERFKYILVDEFQDTNNLQFELIRLLTAPDCALFVVGDPDQNIYTWRGANIKIILDFNQYYPNTLDIILNQNYRSTQSILDVANKLIRNNKNRIHKDLSTANGDGGKVLYYEALSTEIEAQWVVDRIRELRRKNPSLNYSDFAILYRSNYYSRDIERKLINNGLPYQIYGGIRFFERKEIKDAIAYLRLIANHGDDLAFERIINVPKRGIGDKSIELLREEAESKMTSLYDVAKSKNPKLQDLFNLIEDAGMKVNGETPNFAEILRDILVRTGYYEMLKPDEEERIPSLDSFCDYLFDFQKNNAQVTLDEILQSIALYSAQDDIVDGNFISLMTIHTAKGLEFPFVFVVGLTEGVFPSQKSIASLERVNNNNVEEERRLAYVAFTRAEKQLFISNSVGYSYSVGSYGVPSRFIEEIKGTITPYYIKPVAPSKPRVATPTRMQESSTMLDNTTDYRPGNMVDHTGFGEGIVLAVEGDVLTIAFKDSNVGVKKISKNFNGLRRS